MSGGVAGAIGSIGSTIGNFGGPAAPAGPGSAGAEGVGGAYGKPAGTMIDPERYDAIIKKKTKEAEEAAAKAKKEAEEAAAESKKLLGGITKDVAAQKTAAARLGKVSERASTSGADAQAKQYAGYTAAGTGATPAETMQLAQAAATQMGQQYSDQAIQQAVKAAKTSGAMGGQAALAATGQAANAYAQGQQQGQTQYFNALNLGADLNKAMTSTTSNEGMAARTLAAQRQAQLQQMTQQELAQASAQEAEKQNIASQIASQEYAVDKNYHLEKGAQAIDLFGKGASAIGGIAALFSDKRLKEDIKESPTKGLDTVGGYDYKYKGNDRQERGVMAQDLEKTSMAPAVMDTPEGKIIDTRRLSTMNTAALSEHEKRMQKIEKMLSSMRGGK